MSRVAGEEEKKSPSGLDGCDKSYLSFILFLVLTFLPFLHVIPLESSPLEELPTPPASIKTRLAIKTPGDLDFKVAAPLLLPADINLSFLCFISS